MKVVHLVGQKSRLDRPSAGLGSSMWLQSLVADRRPVSTHLPLAWTRSSAEDIQAFMAQLEALAAVVRSQPDPEADAHRDPATPQTAWKVA